MPTQYSMCSNTYLVRLCVIHSNPDKKTDRRNEEKITHTHTTTQQQQQTRSVCNVNVCNVPYSSRIQASTQTHVEWKRKRFKLVRFGYYLFISLFFFLLFCSFLFFSFTFPRALSTHRSPTLPSVIT